MVARDRALQKADLTTVAKIEAALGPSYRFKWNEKYAGEGFQAILDLYGEFIGMRRETGASTTFREFVQKSAPERIEAMPRGGRPAILCSGNPEAVRCCSLRDEGLSVGQIAIKTGLSERQVRSRLEVIPPSNPSQKSK